MKWPEATSQKLSKTNMELHNVNNHQTHYKHTFLKGAYQMPPTKYSTVLKFIFPLTLATASIQPL